MGKGANRSCVELARGWFGPFHIFTASPDCITEHLNQYSASFGSPTRTSGDEVSFALSLSRRIACSVMIGKIAFEHGSGYCGVAGAAAGLRELGFTDRMKAMILQRSSLVLMMPPKGGIGPVTTSCFTRL